MHLIRAFLQKFTWLSFLNLVLSTKVKASYHGGMSVPEAWVSHYLLSLVLKLWREYTPK